MFPIIYVKLNEIDKSIIRWNWINSKNHNIYNINDRSNLEIEILSDNRYLYNSYMYIYYIYIILIVYLVGY